MNKKKEKKTDFVKLCEIILWMHSLDVFMKAALVFGAMRAIRATLLRILAAFDLQVTPHIPVPAVILAAIRTLKDTRVLIEISGV